MASPRNVGSDTAPANLYFWCAGMQCAWRSLPRLFSRGRRTPLLRLALCPVDLWRYHEFRAVLNAFNRAPTILDVGSPKLLARILAEATGATVHATDIASSLKNEHALYATGLRQGRIRAHVCDARSLPFPDASVAFCYAVSSLEHIGADGDTAAVRELVRVTAPGGTIVVTTPLVPRYFERWVEHDPYGRQDCDEHGSVFFSRYYDWDALEQRLIKPAGIPMTSVSLWMEARSGWYERYCRLTRRPASLCAIAIKILDPIWAATRLVSVEDNPPRVTRHGLAALTFQKPENPATQR